MIDQKDVTIIIPTLAYTDEQIFSLKKCLASLIETCLCPIIIGFNNIEKSTEEGHDIDLSAHKNRIKIVALTDQGQCRAVNAAAAACSTPWIFVTNDDMIYAPEWFEKLTNNLEYDKTLCISPKLIEPQAGAPTFERFFAGGAGGDFDKSKWLEFAATYELRTEEEKKIRSGFNLPFLIDHELWNLIGGYDINYDPWGSNSDSDLEYKIRLAGVQPKQNQRAIVYHFSQTSGTFEPRNRLSWEHNWKYFREKWGFERTDDGIWTADFHLPTKEEGRIFEPWWEDFYLIKQDMMNVEGKL